jgi:hypothetical protein
LRVTKDIRFCSTSTCLNGNEERTIAVTLNLHEVKAMAGHRLISALFACIFAVSFAPNAWCNIPPPPQTPVPPEWKAFPDNAPKVAHGGGNTGKKVASGESHSSAAANNTAPAVVTASISIEAHAGNAAVSEVPTLWLALLGALSAGLLAVGAHLVLRQESEIEFDEPVEAAA